MLSILKMHVDLRPLTLWLYLNVYPVLQTYTILAFIIWLYINEQLRIIVLLYVKNSSVGLDTQHYQ